MGIRSGSSGNLAAANPLAIALAASTAPRLPLKALGSSTTVLPDQGPSFLKYLLTLYLNGFDDPHHGHDLENNDLAAAGLATSMGTAGMTGADP